MIIKETITSRNNPKVIKLGKIRDAKGDLFLVEGFHLVEMALENKLVLEIYSVSRFYEDHPEIPQYRISEPVLEKLSLTKSPEGILALCKKPSFGEGEASPLALYLDDVQDPGNLGTLLRSTLAFGAKEVLLSKGSANPYGPKALLASQGALFALKVHKSDKTPLEDLESLRKRGYFLLSTDLRNSLPIEEAKLPSKPLCLILGNEGKGVAKELTDFADLSIYLPISGIDSLNVAVAGSILLYLLSKGDKTHEQ